MAENNNPIKKRPQEFDPIGTLSPDDDDETKSNSPKAAIEDTSSRLPFASTEPVDDWESLYWFFAEPDENEYDRNVLLDLRKKYNINTPFRSDGGRTPLHLAVKGDSMEGVRQLLSIKASVSKPTEQGLQPLHVACYNGNPQMATLLLNNGADINAKDNEGVIPLIYACIGGSAELLQLLLNSGGIDPRIPDQHGWSPLHFSCRNGKKDIVQRLLANDKTNIDADNKLGQSPLHIAILEDYGEIVHCMLDEGADINKLDRNGDTPLMTASKHGSKACVDILLDRKADYNKTSVTKRTALMYACEMKEFGIAKKLLEQKNLTCLNQQDEDGETALYKATFHGARSIVKLFMQQDDPAILDLSDNRGYNALHTASSQGYADIVELLSGKMETEAVDRKNRTALHLASEVDPEGFSDQYEIYTQPDPKPSARKESMFSISGQYCKTIINLLEAGAKINATTRDNETALHLAAGLPDPRRVQVLLGQGQKVHPEQRDQSLKNCTIQDIKGRTALYIALERSRPETMRILLEKMDHTDFGKRDEQEAFILAVQSEEMHGIAKRLFIKGNDPVSRPRPDTSTWSLIEWAAYREMPKVLWVLLSTSPLTPDTINCRRKALELVNPKSDQIEWGGIESLQTRDRRRERDKQTITQRQEEKSPDNKTLVKDILRDPPFTQTSRPREPFEVPKIDSSLEKITDNFEAAIIEFYDGEPGSGFLGRFRSVWEVIYDKGPKGVLAEAKANMREIFDKRTPGHSESLNKALALHRMYTKENPKFAWVHLPATNMVWMNDLLRRIMTDSKSREAEFHEISTFFRDTWLQVPDSASRSRFMKPQCMTHRGLNKYKAIYMPYLTFSHKFNEEGDQNSASIPELIKAKEKHKSLFDAYQDKVVHGSPTLDESYYHFSDDNLSRKDREHRNRTQIITKKLGQEGKESQVWTLLRVNQLWIWVISDELMITSTTHPVDKYEDNLLSNIFDYLGKKAEVGGSHSQPSSAVDMSKILVNYCIDFYEREQVIGTKQSTRQTYFNAINEIAIKETNLYERFSRAQMKVEGNMMDYLRKILKGEGNETQSDEDMMVAIGEAATLSCSIKDIRDELNILKTIAGYQNDVQTALNSQIQDANRSKAVVSWPRKTDLVRRKGMKYHDKRRAWFSWSSSRDAFMDRHYTFKKDPVPVNTDYSVKK